MVSATTNTCQRTYLFPSFLPSFFRSTKRLSFRSSQKRESSNFFPGKKKLYSFRRNQNLKYRILFYFFFYQKGGKKGTYFFICIFSHMSLAYTGNISNLKKKKRKNRSNVFQRWMAFFVENLKYREKKKNSPNEDIETAMEKKNSKIRIKKKKKESMWSSRKSNRYNSPRMTVESLRSKARNLATNPSTLDPRHARIF